MANQKPDWSSLNRDQRLAAFEQMVPKGATAQEITTLFDNMTVHSVRGFVARWRGRLAGFALGQARRGPHIEDKAPKPPLPEPKVDATRFNPTLILDLTDKQCRFPLWGHSDHFQPDTDCFCGMEIEEETNLKFCSYHLKTLRKDDSE